MGADKRPSYLQGGLLQGWYAPNITGETRRGIGEWSIEELVAYLKTGANTYTVASGGMGEEVVHSSSHMTEADLDAVAVYLMSVKPAVRQSPLPLDATDPRMTAGQALYKDICAPCHTDAGTGAARLFPRLAGSPAVHADDPTTLIRTVLYGSRAAATDGAPTGPMMPAFFWRLGDAQVAAVITYIRNAWGNAASPVSTHQVREMKSAPGAG
jgi:mono/diheme cytochrome c family protein